MWVIIKIVGIEKIIGRGYRVRRRQFRMEPEGISIFNDWLLEKNGAPRG